MNIVLMASISDKSPFIKEFADNLIILGNKIIIIDVLNKKILDVNNSRNLVPFIVSIISKIPRLRTVSFFSYVRFFLFIHNNKIDIINIHYLYTLYALLFYLTSRYNNKLIVTFWGEDLYGYTNSQRNTQKLILSKAKFITGATHQMRTDIQNIHGLSDRKIKLVRFGIGKFESIKNLMDMHTKLDAKNHFSLPVDKVIICCAYNGAEKQRHNLITKSISRLPEHLKEKLFLLFPMGYGGTVDYINSVREEVNQAKLPYLIIDSYLPEDEVAMLRISSDITINIQVTDALSASLQEHILANNILLVGDWLPYNIYNELGIFFLKTPLDKITESLIDILANFAQYQLKCNSNSELIYNFNSWKTTILDWEKLYAEIHN